MGKPTWRAAFDRIERAVGAPLEDAVESRWYLDFVVLWAKGPRAVSRKIGEGLDDQLGHVLHWLNIPTRDDVNQVSRQLSVLTAELRGLSVPADHIAEYVSELQHRETASPATPRVNSVEQRPQPVPGDGDGA
jgi:hypothetical protein